MKTYLPTAIKFGMAALFFTFLVKTSLLNLNLIIILLEKPVLSLGILVILFVMIFLNSWRWYRLTNAQNIRMPYRQTILPTYIGIAFNTLLPGSVGGDVVRLLWIKKRINQPTSLLLVTIFIDRLTGLFGIVFAVLSVLLIRPDLLTGKVWYLVSTMSVQLGILSVILLIASLILFKLLTHPPIRRKIAANERLTTAISSSWDAIKRYRHAKWVIAECILVSIAIQFMIIWILMLLSMMMELPVLSWSDFALAAGLAQIINLIPISPGGLGVGELAFANVLLLLHPDNIYPYATVFLAFRLFGFICYFPAIVPYWLNFKAAKAPEKSLQTSQT